MYDKKVFAKNLQHYMDENNISRYELSERLNINYFTISSWLQAGKTPRMDKIQLLADFFGITKSELSEEHNLNPQKNKNDDLVQIIARLRTDNDFFSLVSAIYKLNVKQFNSIKELISAFINK